MYLAFIIGTTNCGPAIFVISSSTFSVSIEKSGPSSFKYSISYKNFFISNDKQDHSRNEMVLIAFIMLLSMFALGLSFHNTQTALPKVFEIRIGNTSSIQIGFMIAIIYFISGATTFVGGLLADRFNLKTIYLIGIFLQFPCYLGIAYISGYSLVVLCILAAVFNASILPTENLLLGRFTPQKYHGVVYGIKFILES